MLSVNWVAAVVGIVENMSTVAEGYIHAPMRGGEGDRERGGEEGRRYFSLGVMIPGAPEHELLEEESQMTAVSSS